ncbi:MAG: radical SAM protein [Candidatus Omnitrophota bacterium]
MASFRVLLVYPGMQMVNLLPSNIAVLSAYLKRGGVDVRLFDTTLYRTADKSVDEIRVENLQLRRFNLGEKGVDYRPGDVYGDFQAMVDAYDPDLVGVSATDDTFALGLKLVASLRHKPRHVLFGGVYPTFSPGEVISHEIIDSVCVGEGEIALLELCLRLRDGKKISDIPNLWVKEGAVVHKNPLGPLIDLEDLPFEDFSLFEEKRFFRPMHGKVYRMIPITVDRGCPFQCSFCASPLNRKIYTEAGHGGYVRNRSVSRILDEMEYQIDRHGADYIYFNSETFFARNNADIEEFSRLYAKRIKLPFWCQTRVETITASRIQLLESMNCHRLSVGIEQGNEAFRKRILKKHFTNQQVLEAFRILEKSSIPVTVNNMIGFPDETRELAMDTIHLNRAIKADSINVFFFVPYSGTPLREYCLQKGYIDTHTAPGTIMLDSVLTMPQFPADQIKGLFRTFPLYMKLPESFFDQIRMAEYLTPQGDAMFATLRDLYWEKYFK